VLARPEVAAFPELVALAAWRAFQFGLIGRPMRLRFSSLPSESHSPFALSLRRPATSSSAKHNSPQTHPSLQPITRHHLQLVAMAGKKQAPLSRVYVVLIPALYDMQSPMLQGVYVSEHAALEACNNQPGYVHAVDVNYHGAYVCLVTLATCA
jgi:hypothetical protein